MVRYFSKSGDCITCPLGFTVKAVCQGVLRIDCCLSRGQTASTDMFGMPGTRYRYITSTMICVRYTLLFIIRDTIIPHVGHIPGTYSLIRVMADTFFSLPYLDPSSPARRHQVDCRFLRRCRSSPGLLSTHILESFHSSYY